MELMSEEKRLDWVQASAAQHDGTIWRGNFSHQTRLPPGGASGGLRGDVDLHRLLQRWFNAEL